MGHDAIEDTVTPKSTNTDGLSPGAPKNIPQQPMIDWEDYELKTRSIKQDSAESTKRGDAVTSSSPVVIR